MKRLVNIMKENSLSKREKEFINSKTKVIDDIVKLVSSEGVALRAGIEFNSEGTFRVTGKNKNGLIICTELTSKKISIIETKDENLVLIQRDEKRFKKMYEIINKKKITKRLELANELWDWLVFNRDNVLVTTCAIWKNTTNN